MKIIQKIRINKSLDKPPLDYYEAIDKYYNLYRPKHVLDVKTTKFRNKVIYLSLLLVLLVIANYFYDK